MSLEKSIEQQRNSIEQYTDHCVNINKPFLYLERLADCGDNDYSVDREYTFWLGVDRALDYYNYKGNKRDALVEGAMTILRVVYNNAVMPNEDDES